MTARRLGEVTNEVRNVAGNPVLYAVGILSCYTKKNRRQWHVVQYERLDTNLFIGHLIALTAITDSAESLEIFENRLPALCPRYNMVYL